MTKNFVFDVDGVVLDFDASFDIFVKNNQKKNISEGNKILPSPSFYEWDYLNSTEFSKMPAIIDPVKFNKYCEGVKVHFLSNIPTACTNARIKNLTDLGFRFDSFNVGGFEKYGETNYLTKAEKIIEVIGSWEKILFVDDYGDNCQDVAKNLPNSKVFLIKGLHGYPENYSYERVPNWDILKDKIIEYKKNNN